MTAVERDDVKQCIAYLGFELTFQLVPFDWIKDEGFHALRQDYLKKNKSSTPIDLYDAFLALTSYIGIDMVHLYGSEQAVTQ